MDCDLDWVISMNRNCSSVTRPDICIFIDVPSEICKERVDRRGGTREIFERDEATLACIRKKYAEVFAKLDDENVVTVRADGKPEDIAEIIYNSLPEPKD